jgi:hypothetical protein
MESIDFYEVQKLQIPIVFHPNAEKFPFDTTVFLIRQPINYADKCEESSKKVA